MATMRQANTALKRLPQKAKAHVQPVFDHTASRIASGAISRAAERTGLLRASIKWESRPRATQAVVGVEQRAFYWKFLEYGTVKMSARPMFRPAAEAERDRHLANVADALDRAADDMAREAP